MITDYFEDRDIEYWTSGKNVTKGWVNIQCLFCSDHSNHLGINLTTGHANCWLCGPHGNVVNLIQEIELCSYREAKKILKQWWEDDSGTVNLMKLPPSQRAVRANRVVLPPLLKEWPKKYLDYIERRGYSPEELIKKYKLLPAERHGDYRFRIIIPFFVGRKMVSYTGMDITRKSEIPYKDSKIEDSVIPPFNCLYNIDRVRGNKVVAVEGYTDVWRIGDGAVGLTTKGINEEQLLLLSAKKVKKVLLLLDADVSEVDANKVAEKIMSIRVKVDLGLLDKGDPDTMNAFDLLRVKKWLS